MPSLDPISVGVTTYNRSEALVAVLRGLAAQDDGDFEIIIADDGSLPDHVQAMQRAVNELGLAAIHVWHPDIGFRPPESAIWVCRFAAAGTSYF